MPVWVQIIGSGVVLFGVFWQARNTIRAQREQLADQIRVQLYDQVSKPISECQSAMVTSSTTVSMLPVTLRTTLEMRSRFGTSAVRLPVPTPEALLNEFSDAQAKFLEALRILEWHEVVLPTFAEMRSRITEASSEWRGAFLGFHSKALPHLDYSAQGIPLFVTAPASHQTISELENASHQYSQMTLDLIAYLDDFRRELQNELLGPLFKTRVPSRQAQTGHEVLKARSWPN